MSEHEEVIVRLDKSNTIIEEIVRCKDCRWYRDYDGCFFSTAEVEPLDYCSYGKRKTEEESIGEVVRGFMELVDATADRKTENSSEKPNNSEEAKMFLDDLKVCIDEHPVVADWLVEIADRKTEPTISKMEQVEDEPTCDTCRHKGFEGCEQPCLGCGCCGLYEPKDEPQTCEDCKHNGEKHAYDYACDKCTDMDKFQHEGEPQTERSE